ncbi:MAG: indolepyruvate oxidoreductase subunit beta [Desulfurispora sp.]|uniref:indolepyruvate oxidoreductase subunit beta n=1 Tax=Desulfurispora sp. TaxID=3014275 RepID=UPI00404935E0
MNPRLDIVICGVGGQGSVLAAHTLARAAIGRGLLVRTSEVIGMAQREGPVTGHVRLGDGIPGPIIPDGRANFLLGLELAEAVRGLAKLRPGGTALVSQTAIVPVTVRLGLSEYDPQALTEHLERAVAGRDGRLYLLDTAALARAAGHPKAANAALLGAFSQLPGLPFTPADLLAALLEQLPAKMHAVNRQAFQAGGEHMQHLLAGLPSPVFHSELSVTA